MKPLFGGDLKVSDQVVHLVEKPVVSVIIPCFNGASYLDECLGSVFAQSYRSIEVVISDDASTDESCSVAQRWADSDSRVRLVRSEVHRGMSANWNRGLSACTGTYVAKLDCDDVMNPSAISSLIEPFEASADLIASFCRADICDSNLSRIGDFSDDYWRSNGMDPLVSRIYSTDQLRPAAYGWSPLWNSSAFLVRRRTLLEIEGWDERLSCAADMDLIIRLLHLRGTIFHSSLVGINYRVTQASVSKVASRDNWLGLEIGVVHLMNLARWRHSRTRIPPGLERYSRGLRLKFARRQVLLQTQDLEIQRRLGSILDGIPDVTWQECPRLLGSSIYYYLRRAAGMGS